MMVIIMMEVIELMLMLLMMLMMMMMMVMTMMMTMTMMTMMMMMMMMMIQRLSHDSLAEQNTFTHKHFYCKSVSTQRLKHTHKFSHIHVCTNKHVCTRMSVHGDNSKNISVQDVLTHKCRFYTKSLSCFYTQKLLHTALLHEIFYTRKAFTHRNLLLTSAF